jgi:oligopeptidase B
MADALQPPVAKVIPTTRTFHGDTVVDEYAWLRDRDDPDTVAYLQAEKAYAKARTAHTADLQETIFQEIKGRVKETDLSVPVRRGPWWYYVRTVEGQQYGIHCRRRSEADDGTEQVLVDFNEIAAGHEYLGVGVTSVSPDHSMLAYSVDFEGDEDHTIHVKDLDTGEVLTDEIPGTYYGFAWAADNATFFYTTLDEARRPYRLWRHRIGTPMADDALVHQEDDDRFWMDVSLSRSRDYVMVDLHSKLTSEVRVLRADDPEGEPVPIAARRQGIEYDAEHQGDRFLIVTNEDAENFRLVEAPVDDPGPDRWRDVIAHDPEVRISSVDAFAGHVVVHLRQDALTGLRVLRVADGETHDIAFPEPVYTVDPGANAEFDAATFRLSYTSLVTPNSVYDYDLDARTLTLKKRQPVLGGYDPDAYESSRAWATAPDGTDVPVSIVHRKGVVLDGSAPALLYGYGAYETSVDPWFSPARLSLLERGFVFAIAHVRGGGERGRHWYDDGKLLRKTNTFTDFIAVADHLIASHYTSADRLAAEGGSAGGLLMGAIANLAPDRFRAIVAAVPFVDPLTSILDPTLPLTVTEWEEWGNPIEDPAVYAYMKAYSPYENVAASPHPAIFATAGLNDPRVLYHEPAKWIARLRAVAGAVQPADRPVVLDTELDAGHAGPSGRYDAWRKAAYQLAFVIDQVAPETSNLRQ